MVAPFEEVKTDACMPYAPFEMSSFAAPSATGQASPPELHRDVPSAISLNSKFAEEIAENGRPDRRRRRGRTDAGTRARAARDQLQAV